MYGECAGDELGRRRRLPFARAARREAEASEPHASVGAVHQEICWLDILVHETALMDLADGCNHLDREAQEAPRLHGGVHQPGERLATKIFEHKNGSAAILQKLQRLRRPGAVQFVPQSKFVCEAIKTLRCWMLRGRNHGQHILSFTVDVLRQARHDKIPSSSCKTCGPVKPSPRP